MKAQRNNTEIYKTLGFNKKDILIYETLKKFNGLKVSEITQKSKLPRMTVHITLLDFQRRNLIFKQKLDKQKYYQINEDNIIEQKSLQISEVDGLKVYKGEEGVHKIISIFGSSKNTHYEGYMSNKSGFNLIKTIGLSKIIAMNNSIRENKQSGHNYLEANFIDYFKQQMSPNDFAKWTKSLERTATVREINKEDFYSESDVYVIGNKTYISNYEKKLAIEINQKETADLVRNLIHLLKGYAHPRSFYDWLKTKNT